MYTSIPVVHKQVFLERKNYSFRTYIIAPNSLCYTDIKYSKELLINLFTIFWIYNWKHSSGF